MKNNEIKKVITYYYFADLTNGMKNHTKYFDLTFNIKL